MTPEKRSALSKIFTAYNKAKAQARRQGNVKLIDRLNKALGILMSKAYYKSERTDYSPSACSCGCKDWQYRDAAKRAYAGACKHMLAESIVLAFA